MVINHGGSDLQVGPTFCWDSVHGYRLYFSPGGGWELIIVHLSDTPPRFIPDPYFQGIGHVNTITVRVTNNRIDAQVNGHTLFTSMHASLNGGRIGVGLNPGWKENADVTFSNAKVWQL